MVSCSQSVQTWPLGKDFEFNICKIVMPLHFSLLLDCINILSVRLCVRAGVWRHTRGRACVRCPKFRWGQTVQSTLIQLFFIQKCTLKKLWLYNPNFVIQYNRVLSAARLLPHQWQWCTRCTRYVYDISKQAWEHTVVMKLKLLNWKMYLIVSQTSHFTCTG